MLATVILVVAVGSAMPKPRPTFFSLCILMGTSTQTSLKERGGKLSSCVSFNFWLHICVLSCFLHVSFDLFALNSSGSWTLFFFQLELSFLSCSKKLSWLLNSVQKAALTFLEVVLFQISLMLFSNQIHRGKLSEHLLGGNLFRFGVWSLRCWNPIQWALICRIWYRYYTCAFGDDILR